MRTLVSYYTLGIKGGVFLNTAHIAVDIGASSGRLIVGWIENEQLKLEEVHRFKNSMIFKDNHYYWDINQLFNEILTGLENSSNLDKKMVSVGIDTWAVDYVLLDENGEKVAPVYAYRDHRTDATMEQVFKCISQDEIYKKTGIQFLQFNTLYQLYEDVKTYKEDFKEVKTFMMIPDYLNYQLSGVKSIEYTNATSTQLLNVFTKDWDEQLLESIGVDKAILSKLIEPGTILGELKQDLMEKTKLKGLKVIAPATHDTGSAIVSIPAIEKDFAYISSGTWSLMGIESQVPIVGEKAGSYNFTNEGGVFGTYRVLKNIMGLWLIQEVARMYEGKYSFAEFVELAEASEPFKCLINPNDQRFLNPDNMIEAIQAYCQETKQYIPTKPGEIARCIFESLAFLYKDVLMNLREISEQPINRIHIIGGGCQNKLLNTLCADFTNCEVYAGPVEATAIGNLVMQMITSGTLEDLDSARSLIRGSFGIEVYKPNNNQTIEANYKKFRRLQDEQ